MDIECFMGSSPHDESHDRAGASHQDTASKGFLACGASTGPGGPWGDGVLLLVLAGLLLAHRRRARDGDGAAGYFRA